MFPLRHYQRNDPCDCIGTASSGQFGEVAQAPGTIQPDAGSVVMYIEKTTDADGNVTASSMITSDKPISLLTADLQNPLWKE